MLGFWNKANRNLDLATKELIDSQSARSFQQAQFDSQLYRIVRSENNQDVLNQFLVWQDHLVGLDESMPWTLQEEVNLLNEYVALWKLNNDLINFTIDFSQLVPSITIKPLILFPLVRNAIKYGYHGMELYPIKLLIKASESMIQLDVSNRVNHRIGNQAENEIVTTFMARLQLHYLEQHTLLFNSNSNLFKAHLLIRI